MARAKASVVCLALLSTALSASCNPKDDSSTESLRVKSSLAGVAILPSRIRWVALPSVPPERVREVRFMVGRRVAWIDREPPYEFGGDHAYLVTSWLRSDGPNRLTVRVVSTDGQIADERLTPTARKSPSPAPGSLLGFLARPVALEDREAAGLEAGPGSLWSLDIYSAFLQIGWSDHASGELRAHAYEARSGQHVIRIGVPIQMGPEGEGKMSYGWRVGGYGCRPDGPPATYRRSQLEHGRIRLRSTVYFGSYKLTAVKDPCERRRVILDGVWYGAD